MTRMHKKSLTSLFSRGSKDLVLVAECGGRVKVHAHLLALHSPMVADLLGEVDMDRFLTLNASIEELSLGAKKLLEVKERLEMFNVSSN